MSWAARSYGGGHRPGSSSSNSNNINSSSSYGGDDGGLTRFLADVGGGYHDVPSLRDSDQDSNYRDDSSLKRHHFSSDSESESSSIVDRFRLACEPSRNNNNEKVIPRFQQSTASTRGRQRHQIDHKPAGRSDSRGPTVSRRSDSREPVNRRGVSREPVNWSEEAAPSRRGVSREPAPSRRGVSREPAPTKRGVSREPAPTRRGVSREPAPTRRDVSREPAPTRAGELVNRRSESREPVPRRRSESREPTLTSVGRRSEFREPGLRRSESQEPGLRRYAGRTAIAGEDDYEDMRGRGSRRGGWADNLRQSSDFSSDIRHRRSESQEPGPRRGLSREPVAAAAARQRSESQGPTSHYFGAYNSDHIRSAVVGQDVAEERTIRAVHAQLKENHLPPVGDTSTNFYDAMRSEVRKAVSDLKTDIERSLEIDVMKVHDPSKEVDLLQRYAAEIEESESRTQQLLSQLAEEERARREISQLASSLSSDTRNLKLHRPRTDKDNKETISKALDDDAQRFIDEFASISASEPEDGGPSTSDKAPTDDPQRNKSIPSWKTGLVAVNTDGVVMPWLDWEAELGSPLHSDGMFSCGISKSYPCSTMGEVDWESLASVVPRTPQQRDNLDVTEEASLQRLRFGARLQSGWIHICRREF